jgi:hypothetical protein
LQEKKKEKKRKKWGKKQVAKSFGNLAKPAG